MNYNCDRLFGDTEEECGKPASLYREYDAPEFPEGDGGRHTMYYCSRACAVADAVALWGEGYDAVGGLYLIAKRRA